LQGGGEEAAQGWQYAVGGEWIQHSTGRPALRSGRRPSV
jgi:hypothetical protein